MINRIDIRLDVIKHFQQNDEGPWELQTKVVSEGNETKVDTFVRLEELVNQSLFDVVWSTIGKTLQAEVRKTEREERAPNTDERDKRIALLESLLQRTTKKNLAADLGTSLCEDIVAALQDT